VNGGQDRRIREYHVDVGDESAELEFFQITLGKEGGRKGGREGGREEGWLGWLEEDDVEIGDESAELEFFRIALGKEGVREGGRGQCVHV